MTEAISWLDTPLGTMTLVADGDGLACVHLPHHAPAPERDRDRAVLRAARAQLTEYFAGQRTRFALPLCPRGTPFQHEVWRLLQDIPFGTTTSYGALARAIGRPSASRAVGAANGRNPIAIIVPCHRVIGADGSLTGYAGGLPAKRWLLAHEQVQQTLPLQAPSYGAAAISKRSV